MQKEKATAEPERKTLSFPMPKSYTPILIILLVIAAFFMGMLITKVQYLQSASAGAPSGYGSQKQAAAPNQPQTQPPAGQKVANVVLGDYAPKGNINAKVKIVEYGDLRCPFCQKFFTDTEPQILSNYVDTGKAS